jgi:hypothetical protein
MELLVVFLVGAVIGWVAGWLFSPRSAEPDYFKLCPHGHLDWDECPVCCH